MYGPLILVNSALADSARIEGEIEKIKNVDKHGWGAEGAEGVGGTICCIK